MSRPIVSRRVLTVLVALGLLLPLTVTVLAPLRLLLQALGDAGGQRVVGYLLVACASAWVVNLAGLVLLLGLKAIDRGEPPDE